MLDIHFCKTKKRKNMIISILLKHYLGTDDQMLLTLKVKWNRRTNPKSREVRKNLLLMFSSGRIWSYLPPRWTLALSLL